jgi:hypothetical protein
MLISDPVYTALNGRRVDEYRTGRDAGGKRKGGGGTEFRGISESLAICAFLKLIYKFPTQYMIK